MIMTMTEVPFARFRQTDLEADFLLMSLENELKKGREIYDTLDAAILDLKAMVELKEVDMDTHVAVKDAIYLPELGGVFAADARHRVPSENFSVKTLRNAIADGKLAFVQPNKNQFVTRRLITEWLQNCQDLKTPSLSSSSLPASTTPESLHTKLSGSLDGTVRESKLDAAKQSLQRLRNI